MTQRTSSTSGSKPVKLVKSIIFLVLLAILLGLAEFALVPRYDRDDLWTTYRGLPDRSVEVLFFGTSMIHANVNPTVIWETSGVRSYVLSGSGQSLAVTPWYLEEALKTQSPKVVVLDIRGFLNESYVQTELQKRLNYTMMPMGATKLLAVAEGTHAAELTRYFIPLEQFHSRWAEVGRQDFDPRKRQETSNDFFLGYRLVDRVEPQVPSMSREPFDNAVYAENYVLLGRFIDAAGDAGAAVLLLLGPTGSPRLYDEWLPRLQADLRRDHPSVTVLNAYDYLGDLGLEYNSDYYDSTHLNLKGAEKYSEWLAGSIAETYGLPSERQDAWESPWSEESLRYQAQIGGQ